MSKSPLTTKDPDTANQEVVRNMRTILLTTMPAKIGNRGM
jgi:hypothetical protein